MTVRAFVEELGQRRVFRVALGYLFGAWIVVEVSDVTFPRLGLPDWTVTLVLALVILGFPLTLILAWVFQVTPEGIRRDASTGGAAVVTPVPTRPAERSIAVLPFVNMSDDRENEYFSDGMTEEILNALAKVPDLRVASRTSSFAFKGQDSDVLELARALRVSAVVEGSVRKAGNRIRVTAQLISAEDGYHLWSDSYDRELEDVFQVQDEIALSIVEALKVELGAETPEHLVERETRDMDAYNFYLKGRYFYNRDHEEDLRRSLQMYQEALDRDPGYARAQAGIADTWMHLADDWVPPSEAYPQAKEAARKALEIDDSIAEAHAALGMVLGWFDWEFNEAELALRRAVATNPRYADAHWGLATILPSTGRLREAIDSIRRAVELDPVSTTFSYYLSRFQLYAGATEEALQEAERAVALDPGSFRPLLVVGQVYLQAGQPADALETFREAGEVSEAPSVDTYTVRALAALDRNDEARALVERLEDGQDYIRYELMAAAWAAIGDSDRALASLEQARADRSAGLIYLHVDPAFDPLRNDPRYDRIIQAVGVR